MARVDKQIEPSPYACTPPAAPPSATCCIDPKSIQESFQVWLQEMTRDVQGRPSASVLTPQDAISVGIVTIRESYKHRRWPKEIVERILAAELIIHPPSSHSTYGMLNMAARRLRFWRVPDGGSTTVTSPLRQ